MEKAKLLKRVEEIRKNAPILGYPRRNQGKMIEITAAIIKTICDQPEITVKDVKNALKMTTDIIESEMEYETIS